MPQKVPMKLIGVSCKSIGDSFKNFNLKLRNAQIESPFDSILDFKSYCIPEYLTKSRERFSSSHSTVGKKIACCGRENKGYMLYYLLAIMRTILQYYLAWFRFIKKSTSHIENEAQHDRFRAKALIE